MCIRDRSITDSLYSMESLRANKKMVDFFQWRESHTATASTNPTDPVERWKQLRKKLQYWTICFESSRLLSTVFATNKLSIDLSVSTKRKSVTTHPAGSHGSDVYKRQADYFDKQMVKYR